MPILKQLTTSGAKSRSHSDLTVEMISAPLADFRHTMHIGRGGEAFGDTSFLRAPQELNNHVHKNVLLHPSIRGNKRSQSERNSKATSYTLTANSAFSLPHEIEDQDLKLHLPQNTSLNFLERNGRPSGIGGQSLELKEQRFGELSELPMFTPSSGKGIKRSESILSFHIDLGPSMLGDVLSVMEQTEQKQKDLTENQRQKQKVPCVSTFSSVLNGEKPQRAHEIETCSSIHSININDNDFLFMDEDEIRV
ncbi:cdc42 effector protein 4 [Silurus asotus]|uniref:Cdc42 effector protein 4 n=1 Tax=Silurus asotus TaxID=30991 RepID=A0AAD5FKL6_SILAS|nr:cdc42 effector protein 4 [Silurus asotus]